MIIDYSSGFFLGLQFGVVLIIIGVEFYFCVFDRYLDKEIEGLELFILSLITILCILFSLPLSRFSIGFWSVLPVPLGYVIFRILENRGIELDFKKRTEKKIRILKEKAKRNPYIPEIFIEIGDIYFNLNKYEEALPYYYRAKSIKDSAEITHKIKIAERENRIQKGEIWICSECGTTNSGSSEECIKCGNNIKPLVSIKQDIMKHKEEIKRLIIYGFGVPLAGLLLIILLKTLLPDAAFTFTAIGLSLGIMYILWRVFWTSL
ncbi:MAG: hypothetical protein N3D17_07030 [bacterium]|nr:hypothetical protein [bacterium]